MAGAAVGVSIPIPPSLPPPLPPPSFVAPVGRLATLPMPVIGPSLTASSSMAPTLVTAGGTPVSIALPLAPAPTPPAYIANTSLSLAPTAPSTTNPSLMMPPLFDVSAPSASDPTGPASSVTARASLSESKSGDGEMDMDISDDDSSDANLIPPPPPPPAFQVPVPQPPPVPNIPLLPIPPVPMPPPLMVQHSESGPYFGTNTPPNTNTTATSFSPVPPRAVTSSMTQPVPPPPSFPLMPPPLRPPPTPAPVLSLPPQLVNVQSVTGRASNFDSPKQPISTPSNPEVSRSFDSTSCVANAVRNAPLVPLETGATREGKKEHSAPLTHQLEVDSRKGYGGAGSGTEDRDVSPWRPPPKWPAEEEVEWSAEREMELRRFDGGEATTSGYGGRDAPYDMERYFDEADEYLTTAGASQHERGQLPTTHFSRDCDERLTSSVYSGKRSPSRRMISNVDRSMSISNAYEGKGAEYDF
ncbi:hypothetical protein Tcan_11373 [Toxocara canis]|uniref:Uncharacterized protein n=1 Tax=Toxocara canis TaxID=6265 RepID=A0A0B2VTK2_TOXCA|nr:hypothetical protein Tcan_11373 [Toxocara canis]